MIDREGRACKRRHSFNDPGHAHELTFSCVHRWPLLRKDRTRKWFVEALDLARRRWNLELWAYVVMPEHAHVLLLPRSPSYRIEAILKTVKQSVARKAVGHLRLNAPRWLDRLKVTWPTGRVEYRFWQQGGGYDRNMLKTRTAWESVDYIHNNPVRRGLASCPTEWIWSSARWYAGDDNVVLAMDACPPPALGRS